MKATDIRSIVVAGAGTMGASMAQIFAKYGYSVTLYDIAEAAIQRGRDLVRVNQESQVKSGDLTAQQSADIVSRLSYTMDKQCFATCDLVVESILENLEIKQKFWAEVSRIAKPDCLLCTNTSGLFAEHHTNGRGNALRQERNCQHLAESKQLGKQPHRKKAGKRSTCYANQNCRKMLLKLLQLIIKRNRQTDRGRRCQIG